MPAYRFLSPVTHYIDDLAEPLVGGSMYFYEPGTTNPKTTYSDEGLSVANTNPLVLNSRGALSVNVWLDGEYRVVLKDANGVEQWDRDPVQETDVDEQVTAATLAALRALGSPNASVGYAVVLGHTSQADGGGGLFVWNSGSSGTDDNGTIILPTGHGGAGRWVRMNTEVVNVRWFGAVGNGVADDTEAIQAAVNASKSIHLPAGTYKITSRIIASDEKHIYGDSQQSTILKITVVDTALVFESINTYGVRIANMTIEGIAGSTTGISFGSAVEESAHIHVEAVRLLNHSIGIASWHAFAFVAFDSYFEKVDCFNCAIGIQVGGSQNTYNSCTFRLCTYGIQIDDQPGGFSIGGGVFNGGVFVGNGHDIMFNSATVRPLRFYGTWFEQTSNISIGSLVAGELFIFSMIFDSCLFQPAATASGNGIMDSSIGIKGIMSFRDCILYADLLAGASFPEASQFLNDTNSVITRSGCAKVDSGGAVTQFKEFTSNNLICWNNLYDDRKYANDAAAGSAGLAYGDLYYNTTIAALSVKN